MTKLSILLMVLLVATPGNGQGITKLSPDDARKDIAILRTTLQEIHPDLYRYTSKQELDHIADSMEATIHEELTVIDLYRKIAPIVTSIKNGHTFIKPPKSYYDQVSLLPLRFVTIANKVYIRNDFSSPSNRLSGLEVKKINGVPIEEIVKQVMPYISLDGFNDAARFKAIVERDLSYYYNYKFGQRDTYDVEWQDDSIGRVTKERLPGVTNQEFLAEYSRTNTFPWSLRKIDTLEVAFLRIGSLNNAAMLDGKRVLFKDFIERSFEKIRHWKVKNLVIDLRDNGGGELKNALLLYSFIADKPFVFTKAIEIATTNPPTFIQFTNYRQALKFEPLDPKNALRKDGKTFLKDHFSMANHTPHHKSFVGNLFVMINGQTGSSAGCLAIQIRYNGRGIIVGEENRDNYTGYAAGVPVVLTLPASGIEVSIPLRKFTYAPGPDTGRGVIPDYPFFTSAKDLFGGNDPALAYVLGMIQKK